MIKLHLTLANSGSQHASWAHHAQEIQAGNSDIRIDLPGWCEAEKVRALIDEADLLAVPSLWPEPFGLIGVEAAREGCPAVAFACRGIAEWLKDDYNGTLPTANPATPAGLAEAIMRCFRDPAVLARFRRNAPQVGQHFALPRHFRRLITIFEKLGVAADRVLGAEGGG